MLGGTSRIRAEGPEQAGKGSDRSYKTFLKTNRTVYIKREMVPKNNKTPDWISSATKSRGCRDSEMGVIFEVVSRLSSFPQGPLYPLGSWNKQIQLAPSKPLPHPPHCLAVEL